MRRIFRQCGSTALQIKSFAIRYHFLFADALLKACQNFCQRKEVKAMRCYLLALSVLMASLATAQEAVDWSSLVEKVMPAVVTIVSADAKDIVQGSGFIISSDGKIVTNFHVVAGKPAILARRSDGSFLVIKGILASDKANDLAILQAEGRNLPFVRLGDSDAVKVGEAICVIGSPMLLEGTVSAGIISAVRELQDSRKLLQITVPISKGSSGSPVFNRKGEVIGVASFTLSEGQNLNFAVPSNAVKALLRRLGITLSPLPPSPTLSFEERFERAYQEAIQVAQKIEDASVRSEALRFIAEATAEAGQTERANQVFQLALQAAQKIEDAGYRSRVLKEIVEAMVKAGQFDLALQVAQKIKDAEDRSRALSGIAKAMAEAGQKERAKKNL
jgi:serine protease Do